MDNETSRRGFAPMAERNIRIAEDNPANTTEAVDSDLFMLVNGCERLPRGCTSSP